MPLCFSGVCCFNLRLLYSSWVNTFIGTFFYLQVASLFTHIASPYGRKHSGGRCCNLPRARFRRVLVRCTVFNIRFFRSAYEGAVNGFLRLADVSHTNTFIALRSCAGKIKNTIVNVFFQVFCSMSVTTVVLNMPHSKFHDPGTANLESMMSLLFWHQHYKKYTEFN